MNNEQSQGDKMNNEQSQGDKMNNEQKNQWKNGTEYLRIKSDGSYLLADGADPLFVIGELSIAYMKQQEHIKQLEEVGDSMVTVMKDEWMGFRNWINATNSVIYKWQQAKETKP